MRPAALALGLLCGPLACGGEEPTKEQAPAPAAARIDAAPPPPPRADAVLAPEALPPETSEASLLERTYPAWSAVLERGSLLARRGQRGAVHGRVAEVAGGTWLLDESPPARGLGIRLAGAGGARMALEPGRRVVAFGAWEPEGRGWVWKVDRLVALAPAGGEPAAAAVEPLPGRLVRAGEPPPGARVFWILEPPVNGGDGWTIGDDKAGPPVARLLLPGEVLGAPYGGQDYRSAEERWPLARGKAYAAPVTEVALRRKLPLPVLRATAPPVAVTAPAAAPP